MTSQAPELITFASTTCVLAAMIVLGVSKGVLNRTALRHCPSCGRYVRLGARCGCG
ncbi:MAG TPA: hypothetical protein VHS03_14730 [Gaiellaceae bacterium]|jgi:hypothetical protein|nr:hypothetical protein [Gaiellaceae bacterium]